MSVPSSERKADLHLHLEGGITEQLLKKLADKYGISLADETQFRSGNSFPGLKSAKYLGQDFKSFIAHFLKASQLLREPDDITLVTGALCSTARPFSVSAMQIYFTPFTHDLMGKELSPLFDGMALAQESAESAHQIRIAWIFDIARGLSDGFETLDYALEAKKKGVQVTALGLSGEESRATPEEYKEVFAAARTKGLNVHTHCGEQSGPDDIAACLEHLTPKRLGHALSILESKDLTAYCRDNSIPIEISLISNFRLLGFNPRSHPLRQMLEAGLQVVLTSDDPGILDATLEDNYQQAGNCGLDEATLKEIARRSMVLFDEELPSH